MDTKFINSLPVLFMGMIVAGEDNPTATAAVSPNGDITEGDALMKAMSTGLMRMGKQIDGEKGDYNPLCDYDCKIDNLSEKPRKPECNETAFNNTACPFYKEGDNLNCYACNTVPACDDESCTPKIMPPSEVSRSQCPEKVEDTPSLSWPCIGQLVTTDNLYGQLYTGYNLGKPICLRRWYDGAFPAKQETAGTRSRQFNASVLTCGVDLNDLGEARCESTPQAEIDKFLAPVQAVYGKEFHVRISKTCYFEGDRSSVGNDSDGNSTGGGSPRTKSASPDLDSCYCIWTLVLGLVAILTFCSK